MKLARRNFLVDTWQKRKERRNQKTQEIKKDPKHKKEERKTPQK